MDEGERTELRHLMVWSKPSLQSRTSNTPTTQSVTEGSQSPLQYANQGQSGRNNYVFQASKPGDRACLAFNRGSCQVQASHSSDLYVCTYCATIGATIRQRQKTGKGGFKITCLPALLTNG